MEVHEKGQAHTSRYHEDHRHRRRRSMLKTKMMDNQEEEQNDEDDIHEHDLISIWATVARLRGKQDDFPSSITAKRLSQSQSRAASRLNSSRLGYSAIAGTPGDAIDQHRSAIEKLTRNARRRSALSSFMKPRVLSLVNNTAGRSNTSFDHLGEEMGDYILSSLLIYGVVDVRALIRSGGRKLEIDPSLQNLVSLPATRQNLLKCLESYRDQLKQAQIDAILYQAAMERLVDVKPRSTRNLGSLALDCASQYSDLDGSESSSTMSVVPDQTALVLIDDQKSHQEVVYAIEVDSHRKFIRVTFRGSSTVRDLLVDFDWRMLRLPNPLDGKTTSIPQAKQIGIHRGFYNYLMMAPPRSSGTNGSKFDCICGQLRSLLQENPGFEIQTTGHSMGGAMATLFAFMLALDENEDGIPKPIRVISFASPRWANIECGRAFQELELIGRIHHIRVRTHRDLITALPNRLTYFAFCRKEYIYRHVGIELVLFGEDKEPTFNFPVIHFNRMQLLFDDAFNSMLHTTSKLTSFMRSIIKEDHLNVHSSKEYIDRIVKGYSSFAHLTLDVVHAVYINVMEEKRAIYSKNVPKVSNRSETVRRRID